VLVAISPRGVEVPVGVLERTWDPGLKFVNKHHRHLTAARGWCLVSHLELSSGSFSTPITLCAKAGNPIEIVAVMPTSPT